MKKSMKSVLTLACAALFTVGLASCQQKKTAGEKIEDGMEQVGEGIEQGAQELGNKIEQEANEASQNIEEAVEDMKN